jgi:hypothetical protein
MCELRRARGGRGTVTNWLVRCASQKRSRSAATVCTSSRKPTTSPRSCRFSDLTARRSSSACTGPPIIQAPEGPRRRRARASTKRRHLDKLQAATVHVAAKRHHGALPLAARSDGFVLCQSRHRLRPRPISTRTLTFATRSLFALVALPARTARPEAPTGHAHACRAPCSSRPPTRWPCARPGASACGACTARRPAARPPFSPRHVGVAPVSTFPPFPRLTAALVPSLCSCQVTETVTISTVNTALQRCN